MGRIMDFLRHPFGRLPEDNAMLREREELRGKAEHERLLTRLAQSEFLDRLTKDTIADITPERRHQ